MLSIAAARLLLCCQQAYWPCERLCILICLSTAVSEPRGYAWSSHSHIGGCPRCNFKHLHLLLSLCCLSLSTVLLWQTRGYPAGHAPVACLFVFGFIRCYLCPEHETSAALLCFPFVQELHLTGSILIYYTLYFWHQVLHFWSVWRSVDLTVWVC